MPKVDHIAKLLKAVAAEDWHEARAAGFAIAASEEAKGHHTVAQQLRGTIAPNVHASSHESRGTGTYMGDPGFLSSALTRLQTDLRLDDVALRPAQRRDLASLLAEWKHRDVLLNRGIERRRKLLFHGPPGCGKSLSAAVLGLEASLPTYVVRIDSVVGAFLGQTAFRIRELFRFAEVTPCILLLDEIDALGKKRGNARDVGELDRVVIALMQELEHSIPKGIVIATSNIPDHLDEALFRRFDSLVEFPRPSQKEIERFALLRAQVSKIVRPTDAKKLVSGARSYAEAARRVAAEERDSVLRELLG